MEEKRALLLEVEVSIGDGSTVASGTGRASLQFSVHLARWSLSERLSWCRRSLPNQVRHEESARITPVVAAPTLLALDRHILEMGRLCCLS